MVSWIAHVIQHSCEGCINMAAKSVSNSTLWHNRLGHMSIKGMKIVAVKGVLKGLKSVDISLCESYVMGKQKQVSFMKATWEPKNVRLKMVLKDVWRRSLVSSLVDQSSTLPSSMISVGKYEFISWNISQMCLPPSRSGKLKLKNRPTWRSNVSGLTMEKSTTSQSLKIFLQLRELD